MPHPLRLVALLAILLLAALLRIHGSGVQSLRGDEAFTIRYWTAPFAELTAADGLAWREPHPLGAFGLFGVWKALAGDSEVAMRFLSSLGNLIGVAAVYAAARQLLNRAAAPQRDVTAMLAALVWAIAPSLIWHSQDARNYALWAGLSAAAFWAFVRAMDKPSARRWAFYALLQTAALYLFFTEAFLIAVYGLYVLLFGRTRWRGFAVALLVTASLHIPSVIQLARLATSGYGGTRGSADWAELLRFWDALLLGELIPPLGMIAVVVGAAVVCLPTARRLILMLALLPLALLYLISTRLNVFDPRYVLAMMPAGCIALGALLALPLTLPLIEGAPQWRTVPRRWAQMASAGLGGLVLFALASGTAAYRAESYHKAPDWRGWRAALLELSTPQDTIIITPVDSSGTTDPAIGYYWRGGAAILVLPYPNADTDHFVRQALQTSRYVWFSHTGGDQTAAYSVQAALERYGRPREGGPLAAGWSFRLWAYQNR